MKPSSIGVNVVQTSQKHELTGHDGRILNNISWQERPQISYEKLVICKAVMTSSEPYGKIRTYGSVAGRLSNGGLPDNLKTNTGTVWMIKIVAN